MAHITWETASGSLGTIKEGIFYRVAVSATADPGETVKYRLISGQLPKGIQVDVDGIIEGTPTNEILVQGIPTEVSRDTTSEFAVRAYTEVGGVVDHISDRTFTLTVTGQTAPEFITPPGNVGTFFDGTKISIPIQVADDDPADNTVIRKISGTLPDGVTVTPDGVITGIIEPLTGLPGTAVAGYDNAGFSQFGYDFATIAVSQNYQFTLEVTDGKSSALRTFEIFVYAKNKLTSDNTSITSDNTFITSDVTPYRTPVLFNDPGSIGSYRANNYFAYRFLAKDYDGDEIRFTTTTGAGLGFDPLPRDDSRNGEPGSFSQGTEGFDQGAFSLPPNLTLDEKTGWLYGFLPEQGATEKTYQFPIRVYKLNNPSIISDAAYFTMEVAGDVNTDIIWKTESNLGTINNGEISTLSIEAYNVGGRALYYELNPASNSKLPQGLSLAQNGDIVGRVSFNTFALDGGTTTFDKNLSTRLINDETTFDMEFDFEVNASAPAGQRVGFKVKEIRITNGGSGYTSVPTVSISAPANVEGAEQASVGVVTLTNGTVTNIPVGNPGAGYTEPPTITISGGGGNGATATAIMEIATLVNEISVTKQFKLTVNREFNQPYQSLYIKAMPPRSSRELITNLIQNQQLIPTTSLFRPGDQNFGVASSVKYVHAFGLTAATMSSYVSSLALNHYRKQVTLGNIKTAQALDANGDVLYEVVYSELIDNLTNSDGDSVSKSVTLDTPITVNGQEVTTVYPNSLINMRDQVINTVGQITPALPQWMLSKQENGQVLGFVPAWVIAYVKPGESKKIAYGIKQYLGYSLNLIDFEIDRYELDNSQTYNWNSADSEWIPSPGSETTFDNDTTLFDGGSVSFVIPADNWDGTDIHDKYLVFPKTNILG